MQQSHLGWMSLAAALRMVAALSVLETVAGVAGAMEEPAVDAFGDPLPRGAVARFGTVRDAAAELPEGYVRPSGVRGVAFSPDGKRAVTFGDADDPSGARLLVVWNVAEGRQEQVLRYPGGRVYGAVFSPDGARLACTTFGSGTEQTLIWELASGRVAHTIDRGGTLIRPITGSTNIAVVHRDELAVYDLNTGGLLERTPAPVTVLALSDDGRTSLASFSTRSTLLLQFDVRSGRELLRLGGLSKKPVCAVLSPDGRTIAATDLQDILLWETATGQLIRKLAGHGGAVTSLGFSPDGRWLASGGFDHTVRLWETASGAALEVLAGDNAHTEPVVAVVFSPAGDRLASVSFDETVLLWNVAALRTSTSPPHPPDAAEFVRLWQDLGADSAATAYTAIGRLASAPDAAVAALTNQIGPILQVSDRELVARLIEELNDFEFRVRDRATAELIKLGHVAQPHLLAALESSPTPEVRFRVLRILALIQRGNPQRFTTAEVLRMRRTLQVLELVGTPPARALVEQIGERFPHEQVIREAAATIARMQ